MLVRVAAVGVCGSDVHYYEHGRIGPYEVKDPLILGHELSGRIEEVGDGVDPARIGERVAIEPQRPCRICEQCKAGRYNLCPRMEFFATPPINGGFSEFVAIQSDFAFAVPDSVSDEAAALMEPLSVGIWWLSGVFRYANTWPLAIELVSTGKVNLDDLVTAKFGLSDAEHALTIGREPGQLKAVVYPGR